MDSYGSAKALEKRLWALWDVEDSECSVQVRARVLLATHYFVDDRRGEFRYQKMRAWAMNLAKKLVVQPRWMPENSLSLLLDTAYESSDAFEVNDSPVLVMLFDFLDAGSSGLVTDEESKAGVDVLAPAEVRKRHLALLKKASGD